MHQVFEELPAHPDVHCPLRVQHAGLEDVGTKQGQESPDDGSVLGGEVHTGARVATTAVQQLTLLVDKLHHRDYAVVARLVGFFSRTREEGRQRYVGGCWLRSICRRRASHVRGDRRKEKLRKGAPYIYSLCSSYLRLLIKFILTTHLFFSPPLTGMARIECVWKPVSKSTSLLKRGSAYTSDMFSTFVFARVKK